jgi:hypothetical protein
MSKPWVASEEAREWHAAIEADCCLVMEVKLRREGLDLKLVDTSETGDSVLTVACIFDGPDSDPAANRWSDDQGDDNA